ncbi:hypothetical protein COV12_02995 [Candidatus Woesearchaeota archaeon CG10_big_fil_rev_8_21_14_0_10_32_24]|nr:MAG: hypothetical protein COV12_02995 [Candidatus Woesearchaeota archaeon CG10_big_fil_rev_8_21_14_0_10_32_24]
MVVIKTNVNCYQCYQAVDKTETLVVLSKGLQKLYQCANCYKKNKPQGRFEQRKSFYCEKCKYKFSSKKPLCPYCNSSERLTKSNITVYDLIG